MGVDDDLALSLPEPPPPAPARREAAIGEALRRFDAIGAASSRAAGRAPRWAGISRPQAGALVAAGLVALIGVPVAWMSVSRPSAVVRHETLTRADRPAALNSAAPMPPAGPAPPAAATARPAASEPKPVIAAPTLSAPVELARADAAPSPQAIRAEKNDVARAERGAQLADAVVAPPPLVAMVAPAAPAAPPAEAAAGQDMVVTAQRRAARQPVARGDWNACTVDDPRRSLSGCRRLVDPGSAGRAAAHLADGLSRAWQGDLDGAIAAFDQAIALAPRLSFAYLNRGLAHRHRGELDQAIADLDQAVRHAPGAARGYYHRSVLLRERGDADRARADEDRAVGIDPRYDAVVN